MKKGQFTEEQIVRILQQAERGEHTIGQYGSIAMILPVGVSTVQYC